MFKPSDGAVPLGHLRKLLSEYQRMAKVPNGIEIYTENFNWLNGVHERYRQTTDGRAIAYSEHAREFTFAENYEFFTQKKQSETHFCCIQLSNTWA